MSRNVVWRPRERLQLKQEKRGLVDDLCKVHENNQQTASAFTSTETDVKLLRMEEGVTKHKTNIHRKMHSAS